MCCRRLLRRNMRLFQIIFVVGIVLITVIMFELNHIMRQQLTSTASIKVMYHGMHRIGNSASTETTNSAQDAIDYIATNMKLRFDILSMQTAQITLFNNSSKPIKPVKWALYGCTLGVFDAQNLGRHVLGLTTVTLTHINGCLYKFEPTEQFQPIAPGTSVKFQFRTTALQARSDLAPNWYIVTEGLIPRTIANTANEDLSFIYSNQKPSWDRYNSISASDLGKAPLLVIPTPEQIVSHDKTRLVFINKEWTVCGVEQLKNELNYLADKLELTVCSSLNVKSKVINLLLTTPNTYQRISAIAHESYDLQVDDTKEVIVITGQEPAGVFYGVQTLLALINDKGEIPQVSIKDSPRFPYRGLMVDVGRNFIPKNEILKLLDVMAMYKMNKFHFHLTENEGWRLEIPGMKELTEVGAKRCHDLQEKTCILSQLGSGPDTSTAGTGYYSTEDYKEILRHATERHIQVIPEFDFPGHSHAAIKSMIARHDRLVKEGKENEAKEFLLNDFNDNSRYLSVQHFTDEAINPCLNSTFKFINYVISALVIIHNEIQPLTLFHFGGDEVSNGAWKDSPVCKEFANLINKQQTLSKMYLKEYFIQRLTEITHSLNLNLGGWSDAFFGEGGAMTRSSLKKNKDLFAYYWSLSGDKRRLGVLAKEGYKVVFTTPDYLYYDHPYEPDYEERGKYWAARFIDTKKAFEYSPSELCKGIQNCSESIIGIEAAVWGETVRTADQMNSMLFPRLLAFAERAWHKASWESITDTRERESEKAGEWERFANTLSYRELGRLDKMGVPYRVPPPAARMIQGKLSVKRTLPGLKTEYSTDKGLTWHDVTPEMNINGKITLRTRSPDRKRFSKSVEFISNAQ